MELTYNELEHSTENLWSLLFTTGYLTQRKILDDDRYELMIPNREIRSLFITHIAEDREASHGKNFLYTYFGLPCPEC